MNPYVSWLAGATLVWVHSESAQLESWTHDEAGVPNDRLVTDYALAGTASVTSDGFLGRVRLSPDATGPVEVGLRDLELRLGDWGADPLILPHYFDGVVAVSGGTDRVRCALEGGTR